MASWLTTGSTAPFLVVAPVGGGFNPSSTASYIDTAGNFWVYRTTDAFSTVIGSNYFTDAFRRGMRKYDIIAIADVNTPRFTWGYVSALSTISTGAGTVSLFSST